MQKRMDAFYKLLVKDSLDREDVEAMEKEKTKNSHEVLQMFRDSNGIYYSFVAKSAIQIAAGIIIAAILIWILFFGLSSEEIECKVFNKQYLCVVPLAKFYYKIVFVACISILAFICSNVYMLFWILIPRLSPFHRFMQLSRDHVDKAIDLEKTEKAPPHFTR